jgi:hypothetical protein
VHVPVLLEEHQKPIVGYGLTHLIVGEHLHLREELLHLKNLFLRKEWARDKRTGDKRTMILKAHRPSIILLEFHYIDI